MNHLAYRKTILMKIMRILFISVDIVILETYMHVMGLPIKITWNKYPVFFFIVILYGAALLYFIHIYNGFGIGAFNVWELFYSLSLSVIMSGGAVYIVLTGYLHRYLKLVYFCVLILLQLAWNALWVIAVNKIYFHIHSAKETVIVYRCKADLYKLEETKNFAKKFKIIKYIANPSNIRDVIFQLKECKVVFVLGINASLRNGILKYCVEEDIQAYIEPKVGDIIMAGANPMQMFSIPIFRVRRARLDPEYLFIKRVSDILISFIALVIFSPFMLLTAIVIKIQDGGPILYKQVRLTKDARKFEILKFRSMCIDAEKDGVARLASERDDRITPIGKIIRAIRFDELPQLINILRGEMSIVGPRPERPEIMEQYQKSLPAFGLRLQVKAGLTGYAQIYGRYNTQPYDKLQMDLMYINNMSLRQDLWLIFATVKILFMKESTSGIDKKQVTAEIKQGSMGKILSLAEESSVREQSNGE